MKLLVIDDNANVLGEIDDPFVEENSTPIRRCFEIWENIRRCWPTATGLCESVIEVKRDQNRD